MKLGHPLFTAQDNGLIGVSYKPSREPEALNLLDWSGVDSRLGLAKSLLPSYRVIVTANDLIACDDYIEAMRDRYHGIPRDQTVILLYTGTRRRSHGASKRRLAKAAKKLKAAGIRVFYFVDDKAMHRRLDRL